MCGVVGESGLVDEFERCRDVRNITRRNLVILEKKIVTSISNARSTIERSGRLVVELL